MTRKDYENIAYVFRTQMRESVEAGQVEGAQMAIRQTAERMATMLQNDNPNFDRGRFLKACEAR